MAIIRRYETKSECVGLFVDECFEGVDSTLITELPGWRRHWSFVSLYDRDMYDRLDRIRWYDEGAGLMHVESNYTDNGAPAWNTWFEPNGGMLWRWCDEHKAQVAECGFTIILHDGEFWGLGVDGGGYSFRDAHFAPLYDAIGLRWHE